MSAPVRYPNGVTTVNPTNPLYMFGSPDPTKYHSWFDDFDNFEADQWVITTTEAGTGSATEAVANADGGILVLTNAAGDNDHDFLQYSGDDAAAVVETFVFESGKKLWFKSRFKVSDATDADFVMGLQITDTSPLDVTDGVFFHKADGDAVPDFLVEKNNTATTTATGITMADDTYYTFAFYYNGTNAFEIFIDDEKVGTSAVTNLPDDEALTISFGIQNGEAAAKVMSVDYIFVAKER